MNFIKSSKDKFRDKDGIIYHNNMINLDNVISILKKQDGKNSPPEYWVIQFICVDGKEREWHYGTRKDMLNVHEKIIDYIRTIQNKEF